MPENIRLTRPLIASEISDNHEVIKALEQLVSTVNNINQGGSTEELEIALGTALAKANLALSLISGIEEVASFETVNKNLESYPKTLSYTGDFLTQVTYTTLSGSIVKTLSYDVSDRLETITLSGDIPSGIDTVKTLVYTGDNLTGAVYS